MQLTRPARRLGPRAVLTIGASLAAAAASAQPIGLVCAAQPEALAIGQVSVRDGFSTPTFGTALITCAGGTPGATVQTCLRLGPGGGGAAPGLAPRYLRGADGQALDYQLTAHAAFSGGGVPVDLLDLPMTLNELGAGSITPALYAEITALASQAKAGAYASAFAGAVDIAFTYGESACTETGAAGAFAVSAELAVSCMIDVTAMDFGTVGGAIDTAIDSAAQITVSCTNGAAYTVGLDFGTNATDSSDSGRRMTRGADTVRYGLFRDPGRTQGWGLAPGTLASGIGTGGDRQLEIFGRVFAGQTAAPGFYSDTVVVVITY